MRLMLCHTISDLGSIASWQRRAKGREAPTGCFIALHSYSVEILGMSQEHQALRHEVAQQDRRTHVDS